MPADLDWKTGNPAEQGALSVKVTGASVLDAFKEAESKGVLEDGDKKAEGGEQEPQLKTWGAQLSKKLKENAEAVRVLSKFEDISELANSYIELEKKQGSMHTIPGKEASDEELDSFYRKLGKPKTADSYSFEQKQEGQKRFAQAAFKANLSDSQAKQLYDFFLEIGENQKKQYELFLGEKAKETDEILQKEYGALFDQKIASYTKGLKLLGAAETMKQLEETGIAYNPGFVKLIISAAEALGESKTVIGNGTVTSGGIKSAREGGTFSFFN